MSLIFINTKQSPESFSKFADRLSEIVKEKEQMGPKLSILNDQFRTSILTTNNKPKNTKNKNTNSNINTNRVLLTRGIQALNKSLINQIVTNTATFTNFNYENDPYNEHDMGDFVIEGYKIFWKIDYYNKTLSSHSPDPCDAGVTSRVLTIMLASEY